MTSKDLPGPELRVSIKLLISRPKIPHLSPSPEHITLEASTVELTVTFRGHPLTCLHFIVLVLKLNPLHDGKLFLLRIIPFRPHDVQQVDTNSIWRVTSSIHVVANQS